MRRLLLALPLLACAPAAAPPPALRLVQIGADPVAVPVTLETPAPDRIAGQAPCNRFAAPVSGRLPEFRPGPVMATEMACEHLALEMRFFAALEKVTRRVDGDGRVVLTGGGETLVFAAPSG